MLIADLKGKLTIHEDVSEDFLTSSVFSTFDFLPNVWISEFLQTSINVEGDNLYFPSARNKFVFWKRFLLPFGGSVEPDLIIFTENVAFIIEAKFYSGKSGSGFSEEEDLSPDQLKSELIDQIAREYFLGKDVLRGKTFATEEVFEVSDFFLILITKDPSIPANDIEESISAIGKVEPAEKDIARKKIFWTNWQKIDPIMEEIIQRHPQESFERKISSQLYDFLQRRNLIPFGGFDFLGSLHVTNAAGKPIFYRKKKRIYWSQTLLRRPVYFKGPNIFYFSRMKPYWEDFLESPKKTDRIFYETIEGGTFEK